MSKSNSEYVKRRYKEDPEFRQRKLEQVRAYKIRVKNDPSRLESRQQTDRLRHERKAATKPEYLERMRAYWHANKIARLCKDRGITTEQYATVYALQNGKCATCPCVFESLTDTKIHRDHDHVTGKFRGLLCSVCNHFLGKLEKRNMNIASYLEYVSNPTADKVIK